MKPFSLNLPLSSPRAGSNPAPTPRVGSFSPLQDCLQKSSNAPYKFPSHTCKNTSLGLPWPPECQCGPSASSRLSCATLTQSASCSPYFHKIAILDACQIHKLSLIHTKVASAISSCFASLFSVHLPGCLQYPLRHLSRKTINHLASQRRIRGPPCCLCIF